MIKKRLKSKPLFTEKILKNISSKFFFKKKLYSHDQFKQNSEIQLYTKI